MSTVTNIILVTAIDDGGGDGEHPNVDALSAHLVKEQAQRSGFVQVDEYAGGSKCMECDVYLCAANHLLLDDFLAAFHAIKWEYAEGVQLMIQGQHDDAFTVYTPRTSP